MRKIGVVTVARSDYSTCLPILREIAADPELCLHLLVGGTHLVPEFGLTVNAIEADGFAIVERIDMLVASDTPAGAAKAIGLGTLGLAQSFDRVRPDILLVVGDRTELLSVACAALPFRLPIAHVSGGDLTEGAIDNQVRHAISKMSHLHFVAMQEHADRLVQMGEESWRITVSGDPALDLIGQIRLRDREELSSHFGMALHDPLTLVTYHPETLRGDSADRDVGELLDALGSLPGTMVFTHPNADPQCKTIIERIRCFISKRADSGLFANLGQLNYYSLLALADVMVGNSSSGIWEAPTFGLPVVNIGCRQKGRTRAGNVVDVDVESAAIRAGIERCLDPSFRASLMGKVNPYGDGRSASRIVKAIKAIPLDCRLMQKEFVTLSQEVTFYGRDD
jgi:UDP-hydrolysing UDP-N-acetyl-D-glucosamine 2-epimerase